MSLVDSNRPSRKPTSRWAPWLAGLLGLMLSSTTVLVASAGGVEEPREPWWRFGHMAELGLTDDQKSRLEADWSDYRQRLDSLLVEIRAQEDRLELLLRDDSASRADLEAQIERAIQARGAVETERGQYLLKVREVLDSGQWQRLSQIHDLLAPPAPPAAPSAVTPRVAPDVPATARGGLRSPVLRPAAPSAPTPLPSPKRFSPNARYLDARPAPAPVAPRAPGEPVPRPSAEPRLAPAAPLPPEPASPPTPIEPVLAPVPEPPEPGGPPAAPMAPAPPEPTVAPDAPPAPGARPVLWWHDRIVREKLALTEPQIEQLDRTAVEHARRLVELREDVFRAETALEPLVSADDLDGPAARGKLADLGRARMELRLALRDLNLGLRDALSPGQRRLLRVAAP